MQHSAPGPQQALRAVQQAAPGTQQSAPGAQQLEPTAQQLAGDWAETGPAADQASEASPASTNSPAKNFFDMELFLMTLSW